VYAVVIRRRKMKEDSFRTHGILAIGVVDRVTREDGWLAIDYSYPRTDQNGVCSGTQLVAGPGCPEVGQQVEVAYLPESDQSMLTHCLLPQNAGWPSRW